MMPSMSNTVPPNVPAKRVGALMERLPELPVNE